MTNPATRPESDPFAGVTFKDATIVYRDLSGLTIRTSDLSRLRVVDSGVSDVSISGWVENLTVNGVEVTGYVEAELDRRHPERVQRRAMRTADDHRAMWAVVEGLWADDLERVRRLPDGAAEERVDGEWSFVETLRHLVLATDCWLRRAALGEAHPFHPLGFPDTSWPQEMVAAEGLDVGARPSLDEVLEVRAGRVAQLREYLAGLTDDDLDATVPGTPNDEFPSDTALTVRDCVGTVIEEECEHHRYVVRDLAVLEARGDGAPEAGAAG